MTNPHNAKAETSHGGHEQEYYDGFRAGHHNRYLDARLGLRLVVALTSPIPGYADGYTAGQDEAKILGQWEKGVTP